MLKATCGNGDLEVIMTSTAAHAHLASEMWNSAGNGNADGLHHSDFGPRSASHLESLGDGNAWGETSFTYTRKNGTIVNGQLSFDSSDLNPFHPGDGDIFDHARQVPRQRIRHVHDRLPIGHRAALTSIERSVGSRDRGALHDLVRVSPMSAGRPAPTGGGLGHFAKTLPADP